MNTFDNEAVSLTLADYPGMTTDNIEFALKIWHTYKRHHQSLKNKRKDNRRRTLMANKLATEKAKHPEKCFCVEDGLSVDHDPYTAEVSRVIKVKSTNYYGDWDSKSYEDWTFYKCPLCGKEWDQQVVMAR